MAFPQSSAPEGPAQPSPPQPASPTTPTSTRHRGSTVSSIVSASSRLRRASITVLEADLPLGMWAATANATATAPTLADIRTGSFGAQGWDGDAQRRASIGKMTRRGSAGVSKSKGAANTPDLFPAVTEEAQRKSVDLRNTDPLHASAGQSSVPKHSTGEGIAPDAIAPLEKQSTVEEKAPQRGVKEVDPTFPPYEPPPKLPWKVSMKIGLRAFWKWFLTPLGFCITIYGLNVVAWGGMLFLLLCNAAPAMCHPTCDDINSPRRKWLEVDSQILNALFCVTGFGLIPWRFRDLYFLLKWRIPFFSPEERQYGLRRLAGIHSGWFRLPGDEHANLLDEDNSAIPLPVSKKLSRPLTGVRAPPTAGWKLDFVIWNNCWNTFLQVVLCGFMWGFSRYNRPSWATGLFIALGSIVAGVAGIMMHIEGKKVKKVEGVPPKTDSRAQDIEAGVNNKDFVAGGSGTTKAS